MAADLTDSAGTTPPGGVAPAEAAKAAEPAGTPEKRQPYRKRFLIIYAILGAALVGAGIGGWIAFGGGDDSNGSTVVDHSWSQWAPTSDDPTQAATQIAKHVAQRYKLPGGEQLVRVIAGKPDVTQVPIGAVIVQDNLGFAVEATQLQPNDTIMFIMCGAAQDCSITPGKPSLQRGRLVRRETLELALHTFKYVPSIDKIVAVQPTTAGSDQHLLVYLKRSDLSPALDKPLAKTLSPQTPKQNQIATREIPAIDNMVGSHLFDFTVQQAAQGDAILVLKQTA